MGFSVAANYVGSHTDTGQLLTAILMHFIFIARSGIGFKRAPNRES
jgi:hypothetical protein